MSLECLCTDPLQTVANEKCSAPNYGNQIVKVFIQKETGTDFDGVTYDISSEADWQTLLAADNDDRIVVFANLATTDRPSADPNVEEGNDVTYGGQEVIDRPQSITGMMKYLSQDDFNKVNQINCWGTTRMWYLDNNDYVWAFSTSTGEGIPGVSVTTGTYQQSGIGTKNKLPVTFSWNNVCQPVPVGQYSFLRTIEGSNESGSTL
jgi:hypothetical protein